jgi:hypothetical protein
VYFVEGPVTDYITAIESIENLVPIGEINSFSFYIRGNALSASHPTTIKLARELGSLPAVHVTSHELYSVAKLTNSLITSIVATLGEGSEILICALSECDIVSVASELHDDTKGLPKTPEEIIKVQGVHAFPWIKVKDVIES